jgi:hypothetical protein
VSRVGGSSVNGPSQAAGRHPPEHHGLPHWPAAGALDAGEQFHPARPATAAVVTHLRDDVADPHVALWRVRLGEHPLTTTAIAGDPHEP